MSRATRPNPAPPRRKRPRVQRRKVRLDQTFALDTPGQGFDQGRWDRPGVYERYPSGRVAFTASVELPAVAWTEPVRVMRSWSDTHLRREIQSYLVALARRQQSYALIPAIAFLHARGCPVKAAAKALGRYVPDHLKSRGGRPRKPPP